MPVDFLSEEQARRYGRYSGPPTPAQLARFFLLDEADQRLIAERRGDHNRLGFAVQLGTVRFLGTFLTDPRDMPPTVVRFLAHQLGIPDPACLTRYGERPTTYREHAGEIQRRYGYRAFHEQPGHFQLVRWLYTRAWVGAERPSVLFDLVTVRLVEQKVLLPGISVLTRLIASIRDRAAARLTRTLARALNRDQRGRLEGLLVAPAGSRQTPLDRLRQAPTRVTAGALVAALERLTEVRALGVGDVACSTIPPGRLKGLARYATTAWAQTIARMPPERRLATLFAWAQVLEATAQDDALDLLDQLIRLLLLRADRAQQKARLRTLRDLDGAALDLREACLVLLDPTCQDPAVRPTVFARVSRDQLAAAVTAVGNLAQPRGDRSVTPLLARYPLVRRFLPTLLRTITFAGTAASQPVREALQFLAEAEGQRRPDFRAAPRAVIPRAWRRSVLLPNGQVDRRASTFCVLERLQDSLRRRDLFVTPSERWSDPRTKLLHGPAWQAARPSVLRTLGWTRDAAAELRQFGQQLDAAYRRTAQNLPTNAALRLECVGGRETLVLTGLDRVEEPPSLVRLRELVTARLPLVDLPDLLLEVQTWTGFADEFTHLGAGGIRVADLPLSLCAVLLGEACNIGLEPLVRRESPALTRARLTWVHQNYLRAETLTRANARLVEYQARIPLAQAWGGGEVASADGLRFVVPVRTLNAGPNSKYFGHDRGITYYNFTSDQFSGFHAIVIPGTLRDSLYILDGLLEQQTSLRPTELMTDTAGYSDVVFGLFRLLGYQFSPRLADVGEARLWRLDPQADYGALNGVARHRVNTDLITRHWEDLLRVAGSLKRGTVTASEFLRTLQGGKGTRASALARAIGELGRLAKTLYLLAYLDDEAYRRRILTQLNRGEGRHSLARAVFHGQRGEVRQRYREGQEDQLGALGLVVNAIILWNTRYLDRALAQLRAQGEEVRPHDIERLAPLGHAHINFLGRYHFVLPDPVRRGQLRPLRDPTNLLEQIL
jgi:TnpA family transposase